MHAPRFEHLESRRLLSAGDVDLSFGDNGVVSQTSVHPIAVDDGEMLSNDKFLLAGGMGNPNLGTPDYLIERFNADGSLDTTFGDRGQASGRFDSLPVQIRDIQVASDGKIVALSTDASGASPKPRIFIARFTADGALDTTFANGGFFSLLPATNGNTIAVQKDGGVLLYDGANLSRYTSAGVLDTSFGTNGTVADPLSGFVGVIRALDDGTILLAGINAFDNSDGSFRLAELNADGSVKSSFGSNGHVTTPLPPPQTKTSVFVSDLLIQPDGKIIALGPAGEPAEAGLLSVVVRYHADGALDKTFGDNGIATVLMTGTPVRGFLDSTGRIYLATGGSGIARLGADGALDASFGRVYGIGTHADALDAVGLQSTGRIIVDGVSRPGDSQHPVLAARLTEDDGNPSPITESNRTLTVTGTSGDDFVHAEDINTASADLNGFGRIFDRSDVIEFVVTGGDGNDVIDMTDVHSTGCDVDGGNGKDKITGGNTADTLMGSGGRDFIDGGNGGDFLSGGGGKDQLRGQGGADLIHGGKGNDYIEGGGGNDRIDGGAGTDVMHGNGGNDSFTANDGEIDTLFGDGGSDSAIADADDVLTSIESHTP